MKRVLSILIVACVASFGLAQAATGAVRYSSCAQLLKDYPRGVAVDTAAATAAVQRGHARPSVRASLYWENGGRLDVDDDGVMCEQRAPASASPGGGLVAAKRAAFLQSAREGSSVLVSVSDDALFNAGRGICRILDRGGNFATVLDLMATSGLDGRANASLVVAAVFNLCPGHKEFLGRFLDTI